MRESRVHFESDYSLEGVLHQPDGETVQGAIVVCHPHPLYGGNMDYHIVRGVAQACAAQGIAALRFNFRGVEGSEGQYEGGPGEVRDVEAALGYLRHQAGERVPLGLAGYSFGSLVSARYVANGGHVNALALIAFAVKWDGFNPDDYAGLEQYEKPLLVVVGGHDEFGPPADVEATLLRLRARGQVIAFPESDHFFWNVTKALRETVASFFAQAFSAETASL